MENFLKTEPTRMNQEDVENLDSSNKWRNCIGNQNLSTHKGPGPNGFTDVFYEILQKINASSSKKILEIKEEVGTFQSHHTRSSPWSQYQIDKHIARKIKL